MFEVTEGLETPPISALIFGSPGVGKTTLAAGLPNCLIADLEKGSHHVQASRVKLKGEQFIEFMKWFAEQPYATLVVDSVTALEAAMTRDICRKNGWENIEKPGYGKGFEILKQQWQTYIAFARYLMDQKGKNVIWIAHSQTKPVKDPTNPMEYERVEPSITKKALVEITAAVDMVGFLREKITIYEKDGRKLATGSGIRELVLKDTPGALAKVRNEDHPLVKLLLEATRRSKPGAAPAATST